MSFPRYPKYKDSGVESLGQVPEHWQAKRLKALLSEPLKYGANESAEDENRAHPRFVRITDITDAGTLRDDTFKSLPPEIAEPYLLQPGDILLARSGATVGKSVICSSDWGVTCFAGYLIRARLRFEECLPAWFAYFCQTQTYKDFINGSQIQATIQNVSAEKYASIHIPQPPVNEQQAIASFLDRETAKIDALIAEQQRLIELLQEKRQAVISHAVTKGLNPDAPMKDSGIEWLGEVPAHWEVTRLGFMSSRIGSGKTPSGGGENYQEQGVLFIRSQNVYDDGLRLDDVAYITDEVDADLQASRVQSGDILLNITGASLGRTCLVPESFPRANVNQHVCIIRLHEPQFRFFIAYALQSNVMKRLFDYVQNGAAREGLNYSQISKLPLLLPKTVGEQWEIVGFINEYVAINDRLISESNKGISLLQERRSALISAAVTGQIDVRGLAPKDAA
jgi:type I restriction enzyme S subunit